MNAPRRDDALIEKVRAISNLPSHGLMELGAGGKLGGHGRNLIADAP